MSQINRPPKGLQDVLGSKNFGVNPSNLGQAVVPTIDIGQFYIADLMDIARDDVTGIAVLDQAEIEVPTGEVWFVFSVDLYINDANNDLTTRAYIDLPRNNVAGDPDAFHLKNLIYDASEVGVDQYTEERPLNTWFPSGTRFVHQLIFYNGGVVPAGFDLSIAALILRVEA